MGCRRPEKPPAADVAQKTGSVEFFDVVIGLGLIPAQHIDKDVAGGGAEGGSRVMIGVAGGLDGSHLDGDR